jgi:hypothetical protein
MTLVAGDEEREQEDTEDTEDTERAEGRREEMKTVA